MDERNYIRRIALMNAVGHDGHADVNSVLGKIISEDQDAKKRIKELIPVIKKIVDDVNQMRKEEQESFIRDHQVVKKILVKDVAEDGKPELPELPGTVRGKVVTAFPPEPSKYPHLGHAKSALINFTYAKKYRGKFILRFEDSNPEAAKKEYYDAILDGLRWLGIKWDRLDYLSDHIPEYYRAVEKLIVKGNAYVCLCEQETVRKMRAEGKACEHRESSVKTNLELWKKMLKSTKAGDATVRIAIDMSHPNAALRDPSIARIIDKPHPRTKKRYRVWPTYDFGTAMLDAWEKVTHRFRTKEFELRKDLQEFILKSLGFKPPNIAEIGRFQIKDAITQGREIRDGIARKLFTGWDDPRLSTLAALRRRGFVPGSLREFLLSTGATKTESVYEWQVVEAFNRKTVDPMADRYFGVINPVKIKVEGMPRTGVLSVQVRPGSKKKRAIPVKSDSVYIDRGDLKNLLGQNAGLMFLCTVNLGTVARYVTSQVFHETQKIHWVGEPNVKIKITMPDGSVREGVGEPATKKLKANQIVQLYRIGFCRVDKIGNEVAFYFAHK